MNKPLLLALALTFAVSGCGGDNGKKSVSESTPTPSATPQGCPSGPATTDLTKKPSATVPVGAKAPTTTTFTDVVVGKGAEAKAGSHVAVKYVGVLYDTCQEFDASWNRGADNTLPFQIGGGVIPGFSKGTTGMRVGGRRQVIIPAADGYGDQGSPPVIPGGATLIFVIDLVQVS
jgi:FKBP-type peptidyl-prolyl cis-trans isomerase